MYICVYVYLCIYIHIYICMYVYIFIYIYIYLSISIYLSIYLSINFSSVALIRVRIMGKKYHRVYQKNTEKTSKKTPENSTDPQKSSKLAPEGACRGKFASWTPKSAKMKRKWRPRGDPWDPPRDPKFAKNREKKVIKNSSYFRTPSESGF